MKSRFLCAQCKKDAIGTVPKYLKTNVKPGGGWITMKDGTRHLIKEQRNVVYRWLHPGECNDRWFERYRQWAS